MPIEAARTPSDLKLPCAAVVDVPDRAVEPDEAKALWAQDRMSLGDCGARNRALVTALDALEEQGKGHDE